MSLPCTVCNTCTSTFTYIDQRLWIWDAAVILIFVTVNFKGPIIGKLHSHCFLTIGCVSRLSWYFSLFASRWSVELRLLQRGVCGFPWAGHNGDDARPQTPPLHHPGQRWTVEYDAAQECCQYVLQPRQNGGKKRASVPLKVWLFPVCHHGSKKNMTLSCAIWNVSFSFCGFLAPVLLLGAEGNVLCPPPRMHGAAVLERAHASCRQHHSYCPGPAGARRPAHPHAPRRDRGRHGDRDRPRSVPWNYL